MDYYKANAKELAEQYNSLNPEDVHASWKHLLPKQPGLALDIGAGSGRDANWLAKKGWQVTAVEPCKELQALAQPVTPCPDTGSNRTITWLNDKLPELNSLNDQTKYQLILVSAVWMHLSQPEQQQAYTKLLSLLAKDGLLIITWRNQAGDTQRNFQAVDETLFQHAEITTSDDKGEREGVTWQCAIIKGETL